VALPRRWAPQDLTFGDQALVLVADGLETPGNLGTLIRTLDACAADALVITDRRTPVLHPKVFRASHGASLTVPYVVFADTDAAAGWLRGHDFTVLLADTADDAVGYHDADWTGRVALVLGNERYGVSAAWRARESRAVAVPMLGRGDSLNAAVAASVLLFEARARQGAPPDPAC
jgi:TrmH family RNA methyltransferase